MSEQYCDRSISTDYGAVITRQYGELVGLFMEDLYRAGRAWTRKHDPTRLHLVGGSAPF